jgi:DeoR family ulaG and ulaABCDEF operon transcriptional repressor
LILSEVAGFGSLPSVHEVERDREILQALEGRTVVTVRELTEILHASEATVRRDLGRLEARKQLQRVRGGARSIRQEGIGKLVGQPAFDRSRALHSARKRAVGQAAAELCRPGDSIILGGGSTVFAMAEALPQSGLDILTNSFPIAEFLYRNTRNRVMLSGGELIREQGLILSPFEPEASVRFYASRLFLGALAVTSLGVMESDPNLVRAQQRLLDQADEIIVLVDSSKFSQRASLILCELGRVSRVITDAGIPDTARNMLQAVGVEVIVARSEPEVAHKSRQMGARAANKRP